MRAVSFQATTGGGRRNPNKKQTKKQKGKTKKQRSWKSPAGESPTNRCVGTSAEHATWGGGGIRADATNKPPYRDETKTTQKPHHTCLKAYFLSGFGSSGIQVATNRSVRFHAKNKPPTSRENPNHTKNPTTLTEGATLSGF